MYVLVLGSNVLIVMKLHHLIADIYVHNLNDYSILKGHSLACLAFAYLYLLRNCKTSANFKMTSYTVTLKKKKNTFIINLFSSGQMCAEQGAVMAGLFIPGQRNAQNVSNSD